MSEEEIKKRILQPKGGGVFLPIINESNTINSDVVNRFIGYLKEKIGSLNYFVYKRGNMEFYSKDTIENSIGLIEYFPQ